MLLSPELQRVLVSANARARAASREPDVLDAFEAVMDEPALAESLARLGMDVPGLRGCIASWSVERRWWRPNRRRGVLALQPYMAAIARHVVIREVTRPLEPLALFEVAVFRDGILKEHGLTRLALLRYLAHGLFPDDGAWRLEPLPSARELRVVLHDDSFTTQDFVVEALEEELEMPSDKAVQLMMDVHHEGRGVAGSYASEDAQRRAHALIARAAKAGFPLRVSVEAAKSS